MLSVLSRPLGMRCNNSPIHASILGRFVKVLCVIQFEWVSWVGDHLCIFKDTGESELKYGDGNNTVLPRRTPPECFRMGVHRQHSSV